MKKTLVVLALVMASCGGAATSSGPAVHRVLWELLRGTCAVVVNTPPPTEGGEADGGVP
jgi:hypothetical protein